MTTIPVATEAQRRAVLRTVQDEALRTEQDAPGVCPVSSVRFTFTDRATVRTEPSSRPDQPRVALTVVEDVSGQIVVLDVPATVAAELFHALDSAVTTCDACRLPFPADWVSSCLGGGSFCDDCHLPACQTRSDCFGDGS